MLIEWLIYEIIDNYIVEQICNSNNITWAIITLITAMKLIYPSFQDYLYKYDYFFDVSDDFKTGFTYITTFIYLYLSSLDFVDSIIFYIFKIENKLLTFISRALVSYILDFLFVRIILYIFNRKYLSRM